MSEKPTYQQQVWELVRMIKPGEVASYGMIASLLAGVTPRMVGYAMSATPADSDIPWWRVINSAGAVSPRPGADRQKIMLKQDGIRLSPAGRVNWSEHAWHGPDAQWMAKATIGMEEFLFSRPRDTRQVKRPK